MKKFLVLTITGLFLLALSVNAQVRPADTDEAEEEKEEPKAEMLDSFKVKYTGGLFGYSKSEHGTVTFDDINERLIFKGEDGKERFSIPYESIQVVFPNVKKVQAGSGRAVGAAPIPGADVIGSLIKKKKKYLIIRFEDQEVDAEGTINFLVDSEELLKNSIYTIGEKAEMKPRGDAYIRNKDY